MLPIPTRRAVAFTIALCLAAAPAGRAGDVPTAVIVRCDAVWDMALTYAEVRYEGRYCDSTGRTMVLVDESGPEQGRPRLLRGTVSRDAEGRIALSLADDAQPDTVLWQGRQTNQDAARINLQGADTKPAARLEWTVVDADSEQLYIAAHEQDPLVVLKALRAASRVDIAGLDAFAAALRKDTARPHLTFNFQAIGTLDLLWMLGNQHGHAMTIAADGQRKVEAVRDAGEAARLTDAVLTMGYGEPGRANLFEQLRVLGKLRSAADLPPDVRYPLDLYANDLGYAGQPVELVRLREEMLAYAQRIDARPDSLGLALARGELAYALQQAEPTGTRDQPLLAQSAPVLAANVDSLVDTAQLHRIGQALHQRGRTELAVKLWEQGIARIDFDATGAGYSATELSRELLEHYRTTARTADAERLIGQWRRIPDLSLTEQAFLVTEIDEQLLLGRFADAVTSVDVLVLRAPPFASLSLDELQDTLLAGALRAHLGRGDYALAARIFDLQTRVYRARLGSGADLAERARDQRVLDALAAASGQRHQPDFWSVRYAGDEDLGAVKAGAERRDPGLMTQMFLLDSLLLRQRDSATGSDITADFVTAAEQAALLRYHYLRSPGTASSISAAEAREAFAQAQAWRKQLGANADELDAREAWLARALAALDELD